MFLKFRGGPYWAGWDIARDLEVVFNINGYVRGMYILDGFGGLHCVGDVKKYLGGPYWPYRDRAKDINVIFDQAGNATGLYLLTSDGNVYKYGDIPSIDTGSYWWGNTQDVAIGIEAIYSKQ
jgi:hypothetical protein